MRQAHERCLHGVGERADEDCFIRADGAEEWLKWELEPWYKTGGLVGGLVLACELITERKRGELERTLLAGIADDLSRLATPDEIMHAVGARPGRFLGVTTFNFVDVDESRDEMRVPSAWNHESVPNLRRTFRMSASLSQEFARASRAGETVAIHDARTDPRTSAQVYDALSVRSFLAIPFHRGGKWLYDLTTTDSRPRVWRDHEIRLFEEVAARVFPRLERARAEAGLRESEQRFRALVTATSDVIYRMSPDWSEMRHLRGREFIADTEEPSGNWLEEYIPLDERRRVIAAIDEAIRGKKVFELEHRVLRVDGTVGWTFSRAIPLLEPHGNIIEWFGAARDITPQKRALEQLRQSEERLRDLNASPEQRVEERTREASGTE